MPLSSVVTGFYYEVQAPAISAELNELSEGYSEFPTPAISAEFSELLDSIPTNGISAEMQTRVPQLLILTDIDLTTGERKVFHPGDAVVKTTGDLYNSSTGIRGVTGVSGSTGLPGNQGSTGLFTGITGIRGPTGVTLNGITGAIGDTGVAGFTGLAPVSGSTGVFVTGIVGILGSQVPGDTGLQGLTGLVGIIGLSPQGLTGLPGNTGVIGGTGAQGITGSVVAGVSIPGSTGILTGSTGLLGATGLAGPAGTETVYSLSTTINNGTDSLSFTVPANTLAVNEQQIEIIAWGLSSTAGVSSTITLSLGASNLLNTTISGAGGISFYVRALVTRIGPSTQENITFITSPNGVFAQRAATALDLANSQSVNITATSSIGQAFVYGLIVRKVAEI